MNRFPMLSTAPKGMRKVPSPGQPSDVGTAFTKKPRTVGIKPQAASTRDYGKPEQAPIGPSMFGGSRV
jgi:hypothetical protein